MNQNEIKKLISKYDDAYYNQDNPIISDAEYDALKAQLTEEDFFVPGKALFNKYKHSTKILSLDKVKITNQDALRANLERLWPFIIQPKLDGLTLVVYEDAKVTRGDGETGENISANCNKVLGIGAYPGKPVRCEAVILKTDFEKLNQERIDAGLEPFKNARNAAAGMLRQKDASQVKGVTVIAYEIIGAEYNNAIQIMDLNKRYNWDTVMTYGPTSIDDALNYINGFDKDSYICDIDGLVIKHIGDKTFTTTGHHYNGNIAIKFAAPEVWTILERIEFSVGRTGKVVPVAIFEPIDIMGSTVSKATLHNMAYIEAVGLKSIGKNTQVCITKANDIIPAVIASQDSNECAITICAPTKCPECNSELEQINDQLFCRNNYCKEKVIAQAVHAVSRQALDIAGLSEETIRKMYDNFTEPVTNYCFPLYFKYKHILALDGFAEKSAQKLANEIEVKTKEVMLSKFLIACGVPIVGKSMSKDIAKVFDSIDEINADLSSGAHKLRDIEGIGDKAVKSLVLHWWRIKALSQVIGIIKSEDKTPIAIPDKQLTFVITGKFSNPRSHFEELIVNNGHILTSSVSKKVDYLIIDDTNSTTTKAKKARELNILLIDDTEFFKLINAN